MDQGVANKQKIQSSDKEKLSLMMFYQECFKERY